MGYRTVVVLYNDQVNEWCKDPELGQRISDAMNQSTFKTAVDFGYGNVFQCVNADTISLAMFDGYYGKTLSATNWSQKDQEERNRVKSQLNVHNTVVLMHELRDNVLVG